MRNLNITFPLLLLLLAAPVWAQKSFTVGEFKSLSKQQQVAVLKAYQEFIHIQSAGDFAPDDERLTSLRFSFLPLAYASGEQDCFFAGWPSSSRTVSSKGKKRKVCSFPKKAGSCGSQSMQCQPVLFGPDLCVSTATQKDRNSAFAQCEQKFQKSGRKLEDVAAKISSGELAAEADELFALVDQVCQNGFQARFGMCRTLEKKVADIRELKKDQPEEIKAEPENLLQVVEQIIAQTDEMENVTKLLDGEVKCDTCEIAKKAEADPEPEVEPVVVEKIEREPAVERDGPYSPQQALDDIASGNLKFLGRDLFPGFGQNRTCVFKNEKVYVLYHHCMANRKEASALDVEVIAMDGSYVSFYVELYESRKISETPRSDYTGTFRVSYKQNPPPGEMNLAATKEYMAKSNENYDGACFIGKTGGAQAMDDQPACYGNQASSGWEKQAESFWKNPGDKWMKTQKELRKLVETARF